MQYTMECMEYCRENSGFWNGFIDKTRFDNDREFTLWRKIVDNVYEPRLEGTNIYLQQDGYLDKEDRLADDLDRSERPINQHWSWDRILRSVFIKQADVLQGMYFFEDDFSEEIIRDNFNYYEPRTVHESSLSPCVHSVLASKLGMEEKAYEMYLRTARLDLDDYNHEADEGLHITSMAGTWMAVIEGFGGKRVRGGILSFDPVMPSQWESYRFNLVYRNVVIRVSVFANTVSVKTESEGELEILIYGKSHRLTANNPINVER